MLNPFDPWIVRWTLKVDGVPFITSSGSHLLPVLQGNQPAMLKIAGNEEERQGGELMEWYGGVGAADVLDREGIALLMERAMGQRSLSHMARNGSDDEATRILCRTAALIHQARPNAPHRERAQRLKQTRGFEDPMRTSPVRRQLQEAPKKRACPAPSLAMNSRLQEVRECSEFGRFPGDGVGAVSRHPPQILVRLVGR
jgi:Aminoglycoside/hydroxyurea antibiotic resistance kinase